MENENVFLLVKAVIVGFAGAFSVAFGWIGWLVLAWIACMVVDYITGSGAACKNGEWSSAEARAGIWHKAGMIAVVAVAALADGVLRMALENIKIFSVEYTSLILPVVLVWYILTELGSILENAVAMGAEVPPFLVKLLAAAKEKVESVSESEKI